MAFALDIGNKRRLGSVEPKEIIEFSSEHIPKNIFMVMSLDKDESIPAILLQLWQFQGGYDHAVVNVMENDFRINQHVPFYTPKVQYGRIVEVLSYRTPSNLTKKEQFFFDLWPESESDVKNDEYSLPFRVRVEKENGEFLELIVPAWTPLQRLPLERIKENTIVELWTVENITNIMRVMKV